MPGFSLFSGLVAYPEYVISVAVFLLSLGATARITRFINRDYLFRHGREWALRITAAKDGELNPDHDLPYLLTCPWCASIWVAGGTFTVGYFYGHCAAFWIVAAALTASYLHGVTSPVLDPPED